MTIVIYYCRKVKCFDRYTLHEINICCIDLVLNSYIIASSFIVLRSYRCKHNSIKIKIDEKLDFEACWKDLWNKANNEAWKFWNSFFNLTASKILKLLVLLQQNVMLSIIICLIFTTKWQFLLPALLWITFYCWWPKQLISRITFICCITQSIIRWFCLYSTIYWHCWRSTHWK